MYLERHIHLHHLLKKDTVLHSPVIVFNIPSGTFYEAVSTFPVPHRTHLPHTGTDPSEIPALFLKYGSESYPSSGNRNGSFPVSGKRVSARPGSPAFCRLSRFSMKDPSPFPERWMRPFPSEQKAKSEKRNFSARQQNLHICHRLCKRPDCHDKEGCRRRDRCDSRQPRDCQRQCFRLRPFFRIRI